jgi:hypothetical protein
MGRVRTNPHSRINTSNNNTNKNNKNSKRKNPNRLPGKTVRRKYFKKKINNELPSEERRTGSRRVSQQAIRMVQELTEDVYRLESDLSVSRQQQQKQLGENLKLQEEYQELQRKYTQVLNAKNEQKQIGENSKLQEEHQELQRKYTRALNYQSELIKQNLEYTKGWTKAQAEAWDAEARVDRKSNQIKALEEKVRVLSNSKNRIENLERKIRALEAEKIQMDTDRLIAWDQYSQLKRSVQKEGFVVHEDDTDSLSNWG